MIKNFMENNVVIPSAEINSAKVPGNPEYLEFRDIGTFPKGRIGLASTGPVCNIYTIGRSTATSTNSALLSYVCEYEDGSIKYVALGNGANFCFTCSMNGCTFGIGSKAPDGTVLVSHANAKGLTSGIIQEAEKKSGRPLTLENKSAIQAEYQSTMIASTYSVKGFNGSIGFMSPGSYRIDDKTNATTVGYKNNGDWDFCFQSRRTESGVVSLVGVFPVTTNSLTLA